MIFSLAAGVNKRGTALPLLIATLPKSTLLLQTKLNRGSYSKFPLVRPVCQSKRTLKSPYGRQLRTDVLRQSRNY
ncbi:uncharacterized protein C8R40DRAFT_1237575, partial [Lentinula edodes]|uniref:uncharacterized protein n=1 Tax=Lentinula edodes TaxID=5353 RepID=UPI001E8D4371